MHQSPRPFPSEWTAANIKQQSRTTRSAHKVSSQLLAWHECMRVLPPLLIYSQTNLSQDHTYFPLRGQTSFGSYEECHWDSMGRCVPSLSQLWYSPSSNSSPIPPPCLILPFFHPFPCLPSYSFLQMTSAWKSRRVCGASWAWCAPRGWLRVCVNVHAWRRQL